MRTKREYPRFIPDRPVGDDLFKGQSQTHLATRICEYIESNDLKNSTDETLMPRIIGIEGRWGAGKSNVVRKIERNLIEKGYYTFTYDAWGHQEDLQRRSILETLTNKLLDENILNGEVSIKMRNGKLHKAKWEDQLSLLLSNKTTTITKSQPQLSTSAIWGIILIGMFTVLRLIVGQLIDNKEISFPIWTALAIECTPIIVGIILAIIFRYKDGNWNRIFTLLSQRNDNTVNEQFTSSEEPSVMEFKNWIGSISKYLDDKKRKTKKIIIVFDNMDRLPSEKVMQLWAAIYTFFAGSKFENIWTIIPYDYKHLCEAISGTNSTEIDRDRVKRFISKTFPVVYNVPQPVIVDYQYVFSNFFDQSFGKTETDKDRDHICQVFMRLQQEPNPRQIIKFINELITMRLQWNDKKYSLRNIALFILKKDILLYNGEKLEYNLIRDDIFEDISAFYPDREQTRKQLCQFAYGLDDEEYANQLPLLKILQSAMIKGTSIVDYINRPQFIPILENCINNFLVTENLDNAVKSLESLDNCELSLDNRNLVNYKWDYFATLKTESVLDRIEYDKTWHTLTQHASPKRIFDIAKSFCLKVMSLDIDTGSDYFIALSKLQKDLDEFSSDTDVSKLIREKQVTVDIFENYVLSAKEEYVKYKLFVDNNELNKYLIGLIGELDNKQSLLVYYIHKDTRYNLDEFKKSIEYIIKQGNASKNIHVLTYIYRILSPQNGLIVTKFPQSIIYQEIKRINEILWGKNIEKGYEDIVAVSLSYGIDIQDIDNRVIPLLSECIEKYMPYTQIIQSLGSDNSAFRLLNAYIIKNKKCHEIDPRDIAKRTQQIIKTLKITPKEFFTHFNMYKINEEWQDNDISQCKSYLNIELLDEYKKYPGYFCNWVIKLGLAAISSQSEGFLAYDTYWREFVEKFLGTSYMKNLDEKLANELKFLLNQICDRNIVEFPDLINHILKNIPIEGIMTEYLNEKMNNYFAQIDISIVKFKIFGTLLPTLGSSISKNTVRGLITHFIKPIYTDIDCAKIIVDKHKFYFDILAQDLKMSTEILKGMQEKEDTKEIYKEIFGDISYLLSQELDNKR